MSDITTVSQTQMGTQKPIVHRPPRTPVTQARLCANLSQVFVLKKKIVFWAILLIFPTLSYFNESLGNLCQNMKLEKLLQTQLQCESL